MLESGYLSSILLLYSQGLTHFITSVFHNISIEVINTTTVNLRGYHTSYTVSRRHAASVSLCGQHVRDGIQLRWLQTASFRSMKSPNIPAGLRDLWTLDDVTVTLHTDETNSVSLLEEESEEQILPTNRTDRCDDLDTITLVVMADSIVWSGCPLLEDRT